MKDTKTENEGVDQEVAKRLAYFFKKYVPGSQREAAKLIEIDHSTLSLMTRGLRGVSFSTTKKLIKHYNLNAKWLATGNPNEHPIAKPSPDSPTLMGQGIKELRQEVIDLKATIVQMEKAIAMMEANQTFFINRIQKFITDQQK